MDLREKKTLRAIRAAFLELRARLPLERITVKELAQRAEISKATFYLHYRDVYHLSDQLQQEVIRGVLESLDRPELLTEDHSRFVEQLFDAFAAQQELIDVLFSGTQASVLPIAIERELRALACRLLPQHREDARFHILLTYQIQGAYYAYQQHRRTFGARQVRAVIGAVSQRMAAEGWALFAPAQAGKASQEREPERSSSV